jgi:signal transduction histidine kinase
MQIRTRLTLQFFSIVIITLVLVSAAIYFFSESHRREDFYGRLRNKATNTAMLLIQVEEVSAELLRKIEADNPVSLPRERIVILDYTDRIIFSTDEEKMLAINKDLADEIRLKGEIRFRQGEYEVLGFLFTDRYDRFVIIAGAVDIYGHRKMVNLRNILLAVMSISALLLLLSGWIYAGRALRPISRIIEQVNRIGIANLNLRVDEGNNRDEMAELASTFNKMLDRLETAFISQKNFIANASHELRTPLTAITGQLDVVLLQERSAAYYEQVIRSVLDDMRNLNSISNRLLLLAQASAEPVGVNIKRFRIDEVLWLCREDLIRHNPSYRISVSMKGPMDEEEQLMIEGDENLIRTLILNLFENACKYSGDHTAEVELTTGNENFSLVVSDHGIGIPEEDIPFIFEPFRRGRNAYPVKGHGIGLSLADRIVRLHQGSIEVSSRIGTGTDFIVILPRKISGKA